MKLMSFLYFLCFPLFSSVIQGSSSSKLSKYLVSMSLLKSGMKGAFLFLMFFQSMPAKKG